MTDPDDVLGLTPYHAGAGLIVNAGAICMLAFALLNVPQPWIGFFVGAAPMFLLCVWVHGYEDDLAANHDTEGDSDDRP